MKPSRKQLLLGVLILVALANTGDWVVSSVIQGPLQELRDRTEALDEAIAKRESLLSETRRAGRLIEKWRKQSLPADAELARSLYRSWLHERVTGAGLAGATVDSGTPSNRRGLYAELPFNVRGRGTLDQFTKLMFDISSAGHLHRVETINITPAGGDLFDLSLGIEALIVSGNKRRDRLATGGGQLLASAQLSDYASISRKNVFGVGYRDPLATATVSAITWKNGTPRIWISTADEDSALQIGLHDTIDIADFHGRVISVTDDEVVIESAGGRVAVRLGATLAQGRPVPPTP